MCNDRSYKNLDADGGLMMLYYGTLMFTNAIQLNDPFDCHPAYTHFIYLGAHLKEKKNAKSRKKNQGCPQVQPRHQNIPNDNRPRSLKVEA